MNTPSVSFNLNILSTISSLWPPSLRTTLWAHIPNKPNPSSHPIPPLKTKTNGKRPKQEAVLSSLEPFSSHLIYSAKW